MVEIDWEKFIKITPKSLTEQEKNDIYHSVAWYDPDFNVDKKYLIHFISVTQEILRFKFEQVESLTTELDELATKQGREEGSVLQRYIEEVELLRNELDYYKKIESSNNRSTNFSNDDFKKEIIKLQIQNENLLSELKEKEKELLLEKKEVEIYASQVANLEREKQEIKRELKVLQDESIEKIEGKFRDSPESGELKQDDLIETIHQKNKYISQLLDDIEIIENENSVLSLKLTNIKSELSETTLYVNEIAVELSKYKILSKEYENKEVEFNNKISGLEFQIEELVAEKSKHDKQLDEYILIFNSKIQELKELLDCKDEEIIKLNNEIKNISLSPATLPNVKVKLENDDDLSNKILQQEEQINILKCELQKATEEINNSIELIEKIKEHQMQLPTSPVDVKSKVMFYEKKIKLLEEKLLYAEEDALNKAKETSNLVLQLREYESNVFGLSEAVDKINKLEQVIQKKNDQIEKLVDISNKLEIKLSSVEEQSSILREKLNLPEEEINTKNTSLKFKKEDQQIKSLKNQLEKSEEELINFKIKYRKMISHYKLLAASKSKTCSTDKTKLEKIDLQVMTINDESNLWSKFELIINENEALRKGMHEILDSIRMQDSKGVVNVQSQCLERLLEALDSRHISGWYHPAMRLKAQLSTEEGKNDELRNQIRKLRAQEKKKSSELQNAYLKILTLENDLATPRSVIEEENQIPNDSSKHSNEAPPECENSYSKLEHEKKVIEVESMLHELQVSYNSKLAEFDNKERLFSLETEKNLARIHELESQIDLLKGQVENPEFLQLTKLKSEKIVLERKVNYLLCLESDTRILYERLRQEFMDQEKKMLHDILKLLNEKSQHLSKIVKLENSLLNSVPLEKFAHISNELSNLKAKCKATMGLALVNQGFENNPHLYIEVEILRDEKQLLLEELKSIKEKSLATEELRNGNILAMGDSNLSGRTSSPSSPKVQHSIQKQNHTHLEKINNVLKLQIQELENRNKELIEKIEKLSEENLKHQEIEGDLRAQMLNYISWEERTVLEQKIEKLEEEISTLKVERQNLQELFEISQDQCRSYQEWKNADRMSLASQREEILFLQASSDDKAIIAKLYQEINMAKVQSSELLEQNNTLKMKLSKTLANNLSLEAKISESSEEFFKIKEKYLEQIVYLYQSITNARKLYGSTLAFLNLEDFYNKKKELYKASEILTKLVNDLKIKIRDNSIKKKEMEIQIQSIEDLKLTLKQDEINLLHWHNKCTELMLKEVKHKRENEFLIDEVTQLRNNNEKLKENLAKLEEESIEKEQKWELKELFLVNSPIDIGKNLEEESVEKKKQFCHVATNTDNLLEKSSKSKTKEIKTMTSNEIKMQALEKEISLILNNGQKYEAEEEEDNELNISNKSAPAPSFKDVSNQKEIEQAEKEALIRTVESLQNLIEQKEGTIARYQDLLKESREEYGKSYSKLQTELKSLSDTLANQTRAYNKLKTAVQANTFPTDNIPFIVEKYSKKIQELEESLRECQLNLSSVNSQVYTSQQEVEKWRNLATERLLHLEDSRQSLQKCKLELESYKNEVRKYQRESEQLILISKDYTQNVEEGNDHLQLTLPEKDSDQSIPDRIQSSTLDLPKQPKQVDKSVFLEVEKLKRQLKCANHESVRLRDQIKLLQSKSQKRPKTTGSFTSRSDSKSIKEESLTCKIKNLEELLMTSKEREKELLEINEKKIKSAEEVAKWNERKKYQNSISSLTAKLKEKEAEVEVLKSKNESLRNMAYKFERDKTILESQLKVIKETSSEVNFKVEKMKNEKKQLEEEIVMLRAKYEEQEINFNGVNVAMLEEKLESQERKLVAFQLAFRGQPAILEEIEKSKVSITSLEKANLKLESENLSLRLKLEKKNEETNYFINKIDQLEDAIRAVNKCNKEKATLDNECMDKLFEEDKILQNKPVGSKSRDEIKKAKLDLTMLKDEYKLLTENLKKLTDENCDLKNEVRNYRYQLHLVEEKNLTEVLESSKCFPNSCEHSGEIKSLKAKLAHKTHLLAKVKELLIKAAKKEEIVFKDIGFLQNELV